MNTLQLQTVSSQVVHLCLLLGLFSSTNKELYAATNSKYQTNDFKYAPETNYGGVSDYNRIQHENSHENTQSFQEYKHEIINKENHQNATNYECLKIEENSNEIQENNSGSGGHKYFSGKNYEDRSLEFNGNHKMKTSIKDTPEKELGNLHFDKIEKQSIGSPISYHSNSMNGEDSESKYYHQMKERETLQRNPYE